MTIEGYKGIFWPCFKRLGEFYPGFIPKDGAECAQKAKTWITFLHSNGVPEECLSDTTESIIKHPQHEKFPPTPQQFLSFYNGFIKQDTQSDSPGTKEKDGVEKLFRRISSHYNGAWVLSRSTDNSEHVSHWAQEIASAGLAVDDMVLAFDKLCHRAKHLQYPPTLNQLLEGAKILRLDQSLPMPDDAYAQAISSNSVRYMHPAVKRARSPFPYRDLVGPNAARLRDAFLQEYQDVIATGNFDTMASDDSVSDQAALVSTGHVISAIDGMLAATA